MLMPGTVMNIAFPWKEGRRKRYLYFYTAHADRQISISSSVAKSNMEAIRSLHRLIMGMDAMVILGF